MEKSLKNIASRLNNDIKFMTIPSQILRPRQAINKAFLKVKPTRIEIDKFKENLKKLHATTDPDKDEEHNKNLIRDFLNNTYYAQDYSINTKERIDLVIHTENNSNSDAGVIFEIKAPSETRDMLTKDNINVKAFHQLVLYYLRERRDKNIKIKNLIISNNYEWFIFDSNVFEKKFADNKKLVKQFNDFERDALSIKTTDAFYKEIATVFTKSAEQDIRYTYFDIRDYQDSKDEKEIISLFKLLSPQHLLKLPFENDSNSLDTKFYDELLHIIGLSEIRDGSKKLIKRKKGNDRNDGSLLESSINELDLRDIGKYADPNYSQARYDEKLFNIALELSITWINRILFLKLLEAQLKSYHQGDQSYEFLTADKINTYYSLNNLFFQVLAKRQDERNVGDAENFYKVPYLNSSLFESTKIEQDNFDISQLDDNKTMPIHHPTVLKNASGKERSGNLNTLEYLFEFLNAYDFSSEGSEAIQEENKTLINASVLGLIFEKINGYKDGSFFTPGFITMYMCRETIRKAVVNKFNDAKNWNCPDFDSLYNKIEDKKEANNIINSLKICDPAVGSGHLLVSALNEIIVIKKELNILQDKDGKLLRDYNFEVVNDELIVTYDDGGLFEYHPKGRESTRVQKTLFHEKQTIIENCLFGVDINPNSVNICRLRLWIELLKNAYYKDVKKDNNAEERQLETLPNIDINIKCGNSLISRFALNVDLRKALKSSHKKNDITIKKYKKAVSTYRNAKNKAQKQAMVKLIDVIKNNFKNEIESNNKNIRKRNLLQGEILIMTNQTQAFAPSKQEQIAQDEALEKLKEAHEKLDTEIKAIENNNIYAHAFEWRFEFPEVLNDDGDFMGFDVMIANPPYIMEYENKNAFNGLQSHPCYQGKTDIWHLFTGSGLSLTKEKGLLIYIAKNQWFCSSSAAKMRETIYQKSNILKIIDFGSNMVFESADQQTMILLLEKNVSNKKHNIEYIKFNEVIKIKDLKQILSEDFTGLKILLVSHKILPKNYNSRDNLTFSSSKNEILLEKIYSKKNFEFDEKKEIIQGMIGGPDKAFIVQKENFQHFTQAEQQHLKILHTNTGRFFTPDTDKYIFYISRKIFENENIDDYPNIKKQLLGYKHQLENRREVLLGRISWFCLWWARDESFFKSGAKLVWAKRTEGKKFTFTEERLYGTANLFFIKSNRVNLKYITALLNSRLMYFYMSERLKHTGDLLQIDKNQFMKIPLFVPEKLQKFETLVNKILVLKKQNPQADTRGLENEIDQLVYQLYDLTSAEIALIETAR